MSCSYRKTGLVVLALSVVVAFAPPSQAELTAYTQDFEVMTPDQGWPPNDLSVDGWTIYGFEWETNPYMGSANLLNQYGPYPAANGAPGSIQGAATGEGGPAQGDVVLNKYSDYNNLNQVSRYIQADTYQQQTVGPADIGLWRFSYDAKLGNLAADSSAFAFIRTNDPTTFFQTAIVFNDSTNLPTEWGRYELYLFVDSSLVGDILTFGFSATSTSYNGSAVFYDNLSFGRADSDRDGVLDTEDNCIDTANADQRDTNGDNFGNVCDADLNGDCAVNFGDLALFKAAFFPGPYNPDADFNGNGLVNFGDLAIMKATFFNGANPGPGPSGIANDCD